MGFPDAGTDSASHLYPQAVQIKLYQAFIFSIPVLFSIILFLLFYLFYLKRRSLAASSATTSPSRTITVPQPSYFDSHSTSEKGLLKEKLKEMMPTVPFDEDLQAKDSICCVCLGEFEMAEELIQIPDCKHIFHLDCIHHWLFTHSTCPLCRCSVYHPNADTKLIIVTSALSSWNLTNIDESDRRTREVISVGNLQSQEHVIDVSELSDRVAHLENSDASHHSLSSRVPRLRNINDHHQNTLNFSAMGTSSYVKSKSLKCQSLS